jgi:hypothetical protein
MRAFSGGTVAGLPGIGNYEIVRVNDSASQSGKMNIRRFKLSNRTILRLLRIALTASNTVLDII